ncbi:hypothetical protein AGLY_002143 [Aphis glycines]|uniref:DNA-directed DNA polymerase n=1 Tax=Aphis glycines TaxID=307491 RepID=A0A6G0U463_APHGL|nr:hypothetical protein AGLY_002143 [Aphis glycines]
MLFKPIINNQDIKTKTLITHKHKPMSYAFYVKIDYDIIPKYLIKKYKIPTKLHANRNRKAAKHFIKTMIDIGSKVCNLYKIIIPMDKLTVDEEHKFQNARLCECCFKSFKNDNLFKVRDHNHFTGPVCLNCNFELTNVSFIPIYFHNLIYDSHFIVRELGCNENDIHVIPNSSEKYISFSKTIQDKFNIKFIDTFRFMSESLSSLTDNLSEDKTRFRETLKIFSLSTLNLVTQYFSEFNLLNHLDLNMKTLRNISIVLLLSTIKPLNSPFMFAAPSYDCPTNFFTSTSKLCNVDFTIIRKSIIDTYAIDQIVIFLLNISITTLSLILLHKLFKKTDQKCDSACFGTRRYAPHKSKISLDLLCNATSSRLQGNIGISHNWIMNMSNFLFTMTRTYILGTTPNILFINFKLPTLSEEDVRQSGLRR